MNETLIPKGDYCEIIIGELNDGKLLVDYCPYYEVDENSNTYHCRFLGISDSYQGDTLLWDAVKECGINVE